jgi:predicted alpha/beta superfamily hydrolase
MNCSKLIAVCIGLFALQRAAFSQYHVTIQLEVKQPTSNTLYLAGSFNRWNPASPGYQFKKIAENRYVTMFSVYPSLVEFKVTAGNWAAVEVDKNGGELSNRTHTINSDTVLNIIVEGFKQDNAKKSLVHIRSKQVSILSDSFYIPQLGTYRRIWLYLPMGYNGKKRFPVLYMLDGQNLFEKSTSGFGEWQLDEVLDSMQANLIVVGIDHAGYKRMQEYSPYKMEQFGQGYAEKLLAFITRTLKPTIDKKYKTLTAARHTAIAGSSMGGLFSYYAILKQSKTFGKAGVFSPAFWLIMPSLKKDIQQSVINKTKLYFYAGDAESKSLVQEVNEIAEQTGKRCPLCSITTKVVEGGKHNEAAWYGALPDFMAWLMK